MVTNSSHDVDIKRLLDDIAAYMAFLTNDAGLSVSIHQLDTLINSFQDNLMPFNNHLCPYCRGLKLYKPVAAECCARQIRLFSALGDAPFFGTCWAGVGEYVFPIPNPYSQGHGFVSVSGYKGDAAKAKAQMRKISQKYDVPLLEMQMLYASLQDERPPIGQVSTLIKPLVYMLTLLLHYLRSTLPICPRAKNSSSQRLFEEICRHVCTEYNVRYSLDALAKQFHCSASHINYLFSKYAGCSFRTYINTKCINAAKLLLTGTHMNVQEISDHLGFANSNYFSTVFRRICGVSPREYRNRAQENAKT